MNRATYIDQSFLVANKPGTKNPVREAAIRLSCYSIQLNPFQNPVNLAAVFGVSERFMPFVKAE